MILLSKIEALLFVSGEEGITPSELAVLLDVSIAEIRESLDLLKEQYDADENRGITLLEMGEKCMIATKKEHSSLMQNYANSSINQKLSKVSLEVLAIIAYQQPITRMEIEGIRGVKSSGSIQNLIHKQLIKEVGRVDGPGRPKLYGTTQYFFDYFGLKDMDELPDINQLDTPSDEQSADLLFKEFQNQFENI